MWHSRCQGARGVGRVIDQGEKTLLKWGVALPGVTDRENGCSGYGCNSKVIKMGWWLMANGEQEARKSHPYSIRALYGHNFRYVYQERRGRGEESVWIHFPVTGSDRFLFLGQRSSEIPFRNYVIVSTREHNQTAVLCVWGGAGGGTDGMPCTGLPIWRMLTSKWHQSKPNPTLNKKQKH